MHCPRCQHPNDATASFCEECGARLGAYACPACSAELKASARFCSSCGARVGSTTDRAPARHPRAYTPKHLADKILQSKAALEGERKQVTVLFADVKGSMELAEQLDPEVFHRVMKRFAALLAEGVHRFEGTVTQFTGDGIMALFGAPIAHEDHARRACYAALNLQEELRRYADALRLEQGLNFSVRIGLNSGEVVVGTIGDDLRMDYTAQGTRSAWPRAWSRSRRLVARKRHLRKAHRRIPAVRWRSGVAEPGPTRDHQMDRRILLVQLGEQGARLVVHVGVGRRRRAHQRRDRLVTEERCGLTTQSTRR